jgi:hypothetical protein
LDGKRKHKDGEEEADDKMDEDEELNDSKSLQIFTIDK